jgi:hypothetical protein
VLSSFVSPPLVGVARIVEAAGSRVGTGLVNVG